MSPLIIKSKNNQTTISQMYQTDTDIANDFSEIIDKIIIDIYLKDNILKDKTLINLSNEEKIEFVKGKRKEILKMMQESPFLQEEYINSCESSFKMTSCVKCCCFGIYEDEYNNWIKKKIQMVFIVMYVSINKMILINAGK